MQGVTPTTTVGRSPFGAGGYVTVDADGLVSVGSELPATDRSGLRAVLPLAVHNKWVVLHDPSGPANVADVGCWSADAPTPRRVNGSTKTSTADCPSYSTGCGCGRLKPGFAAGCRGGRVPRRTATSRCSRAVR